jgi:beta-aspartyl-peptidase (threonine type)
VPEPIIAAAGAWIPEKLMKPTLIVHGGCGMPPPEEAAERRQASERAADAGWAALEKGGSALDAVEAAVRRLEDEPVLNAGTGAYLQADGVARVDASIMCSDGRAGAVAQAPNLKNPIRLARYLLEQDAHVLLSGEQALQLALRLGHDPAVLATPAKIAYWRDHLSPADVRLDYAAMAEAWKRENPRLGTVGCAALDARGRLAAGTSTGGTGQCYPGRVGDSPIIGAGSYATPGVAVSMTGVGERIMVLLSAKRLADLVADARSLEDAGATVMAEIERVRSVAGLVALDARGRTLSLHNTPFMPVAIRAARS